VNLVVSPRVRRLIRDDQGPAYAYFYLWGVVFGLIGGVPLGLLLGWLARFWA
jgi:hypothetical protein